MMAYDDLHPRARKDAITRPPFQHQDFCGYEYAMHHAGYEFQCRGCGDHVVGQDEVTMQVNASFTDLTLPLGRRVVPLGMVCSEVCSDALFARFLETLPPCQ